MAEHILNLIDPATTLRFRTELLAVWFRSPFWVVVLSVRNFARAQRRRSDLGMRSLTSY